MKEEVGYCAAGYVGRMQTPPWVVIGGWAKTTSSGPHGACSQSAH